MKEKKSSREFFIQRRWSDIFSLYSSLNRWLGTSEIKDLFTVNHFPCLKKLKLKDDAQDRIRITIEILEENATICKLGPIHKGRYFRVKKTNQTPKI